MTRSICERREGLCERCDCEYRVWSAASPLWNAVIRSGCINGEEEYAYLCLNCFTELAEDSGAGTLFYLDAERTCALQTVTPSGRVWNPEKRMFE